MKRLRWLVKKMALDLIFFIGGLIHPPSLILIAVLASGWATWTYSPLFNESVLSAESGIRTRAVDYSGEETAENIGRALGRSGVTLLAALATYLMIKALPSLLPRPRRISLEESKRTVPGHLRPYRAMEEGEHLGGPWDIVAPEEDGLEQQER